MKNILLFLLTGLLTISGVRVSAQNYGWAKGIGGPADQLCMDMATDALGNVYIIGNLQGVNVDFDPGPGEALLSSAGGTDIFFAKYDPSGNYLWAKSIGGSNEDVGARIAVDNSGFVYITGWIQSTGIDFDPGPDSVIMSTAGLTDIFIGRYDTKGNYLWAHKIGGPYYEGGHDITVDNKGHVYITGYFCGTNVDFDPGPGATLLSSQSNSGDVFIAKYHVKGKLEWAIQCSGPAYEVGNGISADNAGNICITGGFKGSVDFDPGKREAVLNSSGNYDIFLAKYDSLGNFRWAHSAGNTLEDVGSDIVTDGLGNIILSGRFQGTDVDFDPGKGNSLLTSNGGFDIVIAKYDPDGNYLWARQTGGQQDDYPVKIVADRKNNLYHTGSFQGINVDFDPGPASSLLSSAGNMDIYFAKYDGDGNYRWAKGIGGPGLDFGNGIVIAGSSRIYIAGGFSGSGVDFDPGTGTSVLNSAGAVDLFNAYYSQVLSEI